MLKKEHDLPLT